MKVFGNPEELKEGIANSFAKQLGEQQQESDAKVLAMEKAHQEKWDAEIKDRLQTAEEKANQQYARIFHGRKLQAKQQFESEREEMIEQIFEEAKKSAVKKLHSKEYVALIKKQVAGKKVTNCVADSNWYKAQVKSLGTIKIDKNQQGVTFVADGIHYDLTISGILEAKKEELRMSFAYEFRM